MPNLDASFAFWPGTLLAFALEATLMAGVLLLLRTLFRRWMGPRLQSLLWLAFTLRLCLFWAPWPELHWPQRSVSTPVQTSQASQTTGSRPLATSAAPVILSHPVATSKAHALPIEQALLGLWTLGAAFFLFRLLWNHARLWRQVRTAPVVTDSAVMDVLEDCKALLKVHTPLVILRVRNLPSPALVGLVRPRLLMDEALLESLSEEELRHVLLHELIHLRRLDILWAWLSAWVQVAQWFNPVLWWAFRRMHQDRELACDAGVLAVLPAEEATAYGHTLLKTLECLRPPRLVPALAGLAEERSNLKRRILMIARFKSLSRSPLSWILGGLALACGTAVLVFGVGTGRPKPLPQPIVDKVDYPFVDDPALLGGWRTVDFVKEIADFRPDHPHMDPSGFWCKDIYFLPEGKLQRFRALSWTQGHILFHGGEKTDDAYVIKEVEGRTFLFMQWKSGDYTYYGMKPRYYVFERDPRVTGDQVARRDKVDFPFVDDPALQGTWKSVAIVKTPGKFNPKVEPSSAGVAFKEIAFKPQGETSLGFTWTKGLILHKADETAARYEIRKLKGKDYLFFEFKNGDYTFAGREPEWIVLTR